MVTVASDPVTNFKKPLQARSMITFANIMKSAQDILIERGLPGFNTNAVAERAGVNIGTVYHYFLDKTAILVELFHQDQEQRSAYLFDKLNELPSTHDLLVWTHELFDLVRQLRSDHPETSLLHRAFRSVPDVAVLDNTDIDQIVGFVAGLLRQRFATLPEQRAFLASRLLVETTLTIMDSAYAEGPQAHAFFDEALTLVNCYLHRIA